MAAGRRPARAAATARRPARAAAAAARSATDNQRLGELAGQPPEQLAEDAGGRAPDQVLADDVGRRADREAAADEPAHGEAGAELVEAKREHGRDLGRVRAKRDALGDQADERVNLVAGDEGADRWQRPGDLD